MLSSPYSLFPHGTLRRRRYARKGTYAGSTQETLTIPETFPHKLQAFCRTMPAFFCFLLHGTLRAISTARLNTSPCLHLRPINVVVCDGPLARSYLGDGFVLRCFQHLSEPDAATRLCTLAVQPAHRRSVRHGPLVLVPDLRKSQRPQQIETELSHDVLNPARVPL